ncbi:MAG: endonuclease V [Anaerolineales bacterium]|nr:endonuclease V [Anaerolineales bacterium]
MTLQLKHKHSWDVSPDVAIKIQEELRTHFSIQPLPKGEILSVGGVDVAYFGDWLIAATVVMSFPSLEKIGQATASVPVTFPYIPGLLSFREGPSILVSMGKLESLPDVLLVDGHGMAHPRRFGIASHIGVLLDLPSVGCAKSLLIGEHEPLSETVGSSANIRHGSEIVGLAFRTRTGVKPVYVSVGHKIDLPSATEIIMACSKGFRLPEPIRCAHNLATQKCLQLRIN